jgi:Integrase zinc binding domain
MQRVQAQPQQFQPIAFGHNNLLICFRRIPTDTPRICIPTDHLDNIIIWYHVVLTHAGITRLYDSISTHFHHPFLRRLIEELVCRCDVCQQFKLTGPGHGELPPRNVTLLPFFEVALDLIGPWTVTVHEQQIFVNALTCIDPVTCLAEVVWIDNKTAMHVANKFQNNWLARYPRPYRCVHDNGQEFLGYHFQQMLLLNGIQDVTTTIKNPQANAICERMHQTVGNLLRSLLHSYLPQNVANANELIDSALATAMHALCATVHRSLEVSPGALVFHRDMFLNIPLHADLNFHISLSRRLCWQIYCAAKGFEATWNCK